MHSVERSEADAVCYDMHPNKELRNSFNWNILAILYAAFTEAVFLFIYQDFSSFPSVFISRLENVPIIFNVILLQLPFKD